eukprot:m.11538 g.11538  ORF g.11538 m.11538 type:complete len:80 (+) comp9838_c0_seq1:81-320(+)
MADILANEVEMEAMTDLFNKLTKTCQDKCVNQTFTESAELTKGESVCIDRCVAKFLEVHDMVGKHMAKMQQQTQGGPAA